MWYKEWQAVRFKFWVWLAFYGLGAGLFILMWPRNEEHLTTAFQDWSGGAFLMTVIVSVLGGIDVVTEEKSGNTISFLLSRPIKRSRIYITKLAVNSLALLLAFSVGSGVVFLYDRLYPTDVTIKQWVTWQADPNTWYSGWATVGHAVQSCDLFTALATLGLMALAGVCIVCLSGLFSVITPSTMLAMLATGSALFSVGIIAIAVGYREDFASGSYNWLYTINPISASILMFTTIILVAVGTLSFKHKAF